jgi:outer membrane receptor for ferric coprogen and ferric-rhodotorulic acid
VEFAHGELASTGNFFQWDGSYPEPVFSTEATPISDRDIEQNGFYTAGRFVLADPLKLIAGVRFSTFDMDYFSLYDAAPEGQYDFDKTIPYAGLVYDLNSSFSTFVSYTEIFKPQNSRGITGAYLDPIDGRSFEAGIKGEHFAGRLNTALTLFQTRQNNVAGPVYDPETGEAVLLPDGTSVSQPIDGTKTRGFEFELSGELRPDWNASLGWTRYKLEDAEGEDVRTFVPRTLIRAFTTWKAPGAWSKLTLGGGVNYQSSSFTFVGTPDGGTTLNQGDVTLLSLMARYEVTSNASVQINGENLLDKKYFVLDEYDNTYFGAPLNVSVGVSLRF